MKKPLPTLILFAIFGFLWSANLIVPVSGGRTIYPNGKLVPTFVNNSEQYWVNITNTFERYVFGKSAETMREWNRVLGSGDLRNKVSKQCLDVIGHMIRDPLDEAWSAKSK